MDKLEKVIKGLECCCVKPVPECEACPYADDVDGTCFTIDKMLSDALALLKAQEQATIEPKRIDLADETKAWLDKMDAVEALSNIANICMDWDGYRTANGLGGLINEIWAYARYCANMLLKAQEPRVMTIQEVARCSMCWLEDESALVPALFISMEKRANGEKCDVFLAVIPDNDDCEFWYNIDEYGVTWRCWTARPTDEQREAVKWDE